MSGGDKYLLIRVIGQYVVNGLDFGVRARELQSSAGILVDFAAAPRSPACLHYDHNYPYTR